ncbi:restriction endonuclease [Chitinophaga ginsengisegetis]|uniref:restriction endonuclease n=1 Tax=Chitinophaga ginsengisegetis TaxID=393003 RepID=UPI000DBAC2A5|nr:restriction endonuclease [Chitinophaga ginsengisegetis]MDR6568246.1 hypothetical protein [Chitinophaga ginsengisegetis]MDR6648523.1 hypothetical protein [Chitinophaga ginsengisegetis]MDR6654327.1 hypothetical protein [Chitinophaga ginsengisegetis]
MGTKQPSILVTKASGVTVPFSAEKIRQSLKRSGARPEVIDTVLDELHQQVYPNMPTRMIYKIAYGLLKKLSKPSAGRYQLKQAIFELGPSGFPFEQYVAELFRQEGFTATTNQILEGHCVKHEVDILAVKNNITNIMECKYHQQRGTFCDVKIPLYVESRFRDIERQWKSTHEKKQQHCEAWLITNTRFSTDAVQYAQCMGLHLMSWDFPAGKSLKDIIDKAGLYPVTCLTTLSRSEKCRLLERGIILCKTLAEHSSYLEEAGIAAPRRDLAIAEAQHLCKELTKPEMA